MVFFAVNVVDETIVATSRFVTVATLIALARMLVEKTSDGMSQLPGPIPMVNIIKYKPSDIIVTGSYLLPKKLNANTNKAIIIPVRDKKNRGRLPIVSNIFMATNMKENLSIPRKINHPACS
mmetsp:Transcript_25577/g.38195  ORF Transcript_25577/g.38195 Transcript_25577/m.38195 type:complete len:122 (-) Transcript_25577:1119-1484(-)